MNLALAKYFEIATSKVVTNPNEQMVKVREQLSILRLPDEIVLKLDEEQLPISGPVLRHLARHFTYVGGKLCSPDIDLSSDWLEISLPRGWFEEGQVENYVEYLGSLHNLGRISSDTELSGPPPESYLESFRNA